MAKRIIIILVLVFFLLPVLSSCTKPFIQGDEAVWIQEVDGKGYIVAGYTRFIMGRDDEMTVSPWVMKIDSQGEKEWKKTLEKEDFFPEKIIPAGDDGYYIGGRTGLHMGQTCIIRIDSKGNILSSNSYEITTGKNPNIAYTKTGIIIAGTESSNDGTDLRVVKIDFDKEEVWSETYPDKGTDRNILVDSGKHGYTYVVASSYIVLDEVFQKRLLKIDSDGNLIWEKNIEDDIIYKAKALKVTDTEEFIISGSDSSYNGKIVKFDENGEVLWSRSFEGDSYDTFNHIIQTNTGDYVFAGQTQSFGDEGSVLLLKTDSEGEEKWMRVFSASEIDIVNCLSQTDEGYIFAGSMIYPGQRHARLEATDAWLVRTDSEGSEKWTKTFAGIGTYDARNVAFEQLKHMSSVTMGIFLIFILPFIIFNMIFFAFYFRSMKREKARIPLWVFVFLFLGPLAPPLYKSRKKEDEILTKKSKVHLLTKNFLIPWTVYALILPIIIFILVIFEEQGFHIIGEYIFWGLFIYAIAVIPVWFAVLFISGVVALATMSKKNQ